MSATEFHGFERQEPSLGARLSTWLDARYRGVVAAQKRPESFPTTPSFGRMVGASTAPGSCGAVADSGTRRRSPRDPGGCPRWRAALDGSERGASPCGVVAELRAEQQRGRKIEKAFGQYVSPHVVDRLMADPDGLSLGGETRDVTVLFADIRGFTALAEAMKGDLQRLAGLVNMILSPMTDIVLAHGGTIDKYMGDCVMAFWGAPLDDPDHARHAFEAGQAMLAAMADINRRLQAIFATEADLPTISIGVGINSGACVVGNLGSHKRFDYSVLGDPVNVASRLEGLCKAYDTTLLVGEETARRLGPDAGLIEIDRVALRGRDEPQSVFKLA